MKLESTPPRFNNNARNHSTKTPAGFKRWFQLGGRLRRYTAVLDRVRQAVQVRGRAGLVGLRADRVVTEYHVVPVHHQMYKCTIIPSSPCPTV